MTRRSKGPAGPGRCCCCRRAGARSTRKPCAAFADGPGVTLVCGRFEGVDERVIEARSIEEISLGDFVLSGGEPAAIALIDACVRLLPGVVGRADTLEEESFAAGLLEYPHYTRPQVWQDRAVPEVLVSGNHAQIRQWRRAQAERLTRERRPDLWRRYVGGAKAGESRREGER